MFFTLLTDKNQMLFPYLVGNSGDSSRRVFVLSVRSSEITD